MYVDPSGWSYAVAPETIGMPSVGLIDLSYAYTSAVRFVYCNMMKLRPKHVVSALVSHSLTAVVFGEGSSARLVIVDTLRVVLIVAMVSQDQF